MKTKAVRLYGESDLRLEEFELPEIKENEILVRVMSDSLCMSTYKEAKQGAKHIRVPNDVADRPVIIGHEFAGDIVKVGAKWKNQYHEGKRFALLPGISDQMGAPGYSYEFFGGDCTYCIIHPDAIEKDCFFEIDFDSYFEVSVIEPLYCVIGGFHANMHLTSKSHQPIFSTKADGNVIILGGCGPMGIMAINYALVKKKPPKRIVVTEIDETKINRVKQLLTPEKAKSEYGIDLHYVNTATCTDEVQDLLDLSEGEGYHDVFVYAPVQHIAEVGNEIMAFDGCMNMFAGPTDKQFKANINLYDAHYKNTKIIGSSGGLREDFVESLELIKLGKINPAYMITHIGGLDSVVETTLTLPQIEGAKKLIYTHIEMPLTAISAFKDIQDSSGLFSALHKSCEAHDGLWNREAEQILLKNYGVE